MTDTSDISRYAAGVKTLIATFVEAYKKKFERSPNIGPTAVNMVYTAIIKAEADCGDLDKAVAMLDRATRYYVLTYEHDGYSVELGRLMSGRTELTFILDRCIENTSPGAKSATAQLMEDRRLTKQQAIQSIQRGEGVDLKQFSPGGYKQQHGFEYAYRACTDYLKSKGIKTFDFVGQPNLKYIMNIMLDQTKEEIDAATAFCEDQLVKLKAQYDHLPTVEGWNDKRSGRDILADSLRL